MQVRTSYRKTPLYNQPIQAKWLIPEFPRSLCFLRQHPSSRVTVTSNDTARASDHVLHSLGDRGGRRWHSSIAPGELEEHFHTFLISCSSGGSESLALGPLRCWRRHKVLSRAALNPPPLSLLPRDVLIPCQTGYGKKPLALTRHRGLFQVLFRVSPKLSQGNHLPCKHPTPFICPSMARAQDKMA